MKSALLLLSLISPLSISGPVEEISKDRVDASVVHLKEAVAGMVEAIEAVRRMHERPDDLTDLQAWAMALKGEISDLEEKVEALGDAVEELQETEEEEHKDRRSSGRLHCHRHPYCCSFGCRHPCCMNTDLVPEFSAEALVEAIAEANATALPNIKAQIQAEVDAINNSETNVDSGSEEDVNSNAGMNEDTAVDLSADPEMIADPDVNADTAINT